MSPPSLSPTVDEEGPTVDRCQKSRRTNWNLDQDNCIVVPFPLPRLGGRDSTVTSRSPDGPPVAQAPLAPLVPDAGPRHLGPSTQGRQGSEYRGDRRRSRRDGKLKIKGPLLPPPSEPVALINKH